MEKHTAHNWERPIQKDIAKFAVSLIACIIMTYAVGAAAAEAPASKPGKAAATGGVPDAQWKPLYDKGHDLVAVGTVLTVIGGGSILGLGLYALVTAAGCDLGNLASETSSESASICGNVPGSTASIIVIAFGLSVLTAGIALLVTGVRKKREAGRIKKGLTLTGLGVAPANDLSGASMTLAWRF